MKVSIIIPVYNVAECVGDCIKSVIKQTYKNIEVVIVNDCTNDNSMEIIKEIIAESGFQQVKYINHKQNGGLSVARNTGINESTGDFLYFLDSDDELTPDCIEKLVNAQRIFRAEVVVGDYDVINRSKKGYPLLKVSSSVIKGNKKILKNMNKIYVMAWNKLIKKDFVLLHKLFFEPGFIHEDDLWNFKVLCHTSIIAIVKDVTYLYKIRQHSIMSDICLEKEIKFRSLVAQKAAEYAQKNSLLEIRHIHSFIEGQKFEAISCCNKKNSKDQFDIIYNFYKTLPIAKNINIFRWYIFNKKKMIRDAYYFLPEPLRRDYCWSMPSYVFHRKQIGSKFYKWFFNVIFRSFFRLPIKNFSN